MKKIIFAVCFSLFAFVSVAEQGGYDYTDFYKPTEWTFPVLNGTIHYNDPFGKPLSDTYNLIPNENGVYDMDLPDMAGSFDAESATMTAIEASIDAAKAYAQAKYVQEQVKTFAYNLSTILTSTGLDLDNGSGGKTIKIRFTAGSLGRALAAASRPSDVGGGDAPPDVIGGTIEGVSGGETMKINTAMFVTNRTDKHELELRDYDFVANNISASQSSGGEPIIPHFWNSYNLKHGFLSSFFNPLNFEAVVDSSASKRISLKGWADDSQNYEKPFLEMLTEEATSDRSSHSILTRYGTGENAVFHYVPMGDRLVFPPACPPVDERVFTTNGTERGRLELRDMSILEGLVSEDGGYIIPCFAINSTLRYQPVIDMFDTALFQSGMPTLGGAIQTVQLKGWDSASAFCVPYTHTDGTLSWQHIQDFFDGDIFEWHTGEGTGASYLQLKGWDDSTDLKFLLKNGEQLEMKTVPEMLDETLAFDTEENKFGVTGASDYVGKSASRYFGTSRDENATLGWHELPNVTTNYVEGDEITISSTIETVNGVEAKIVGLKGWNENYKGNTPLVLVNDGGALAYRPLPDINTNVAYNCTNLWKETVAWFGDNARNNSGSDFIKEGRISFADNSLSDFLKRNHFVFFEGGGEDEQFSFRKNSTGVTASFDAPKNWADDSSIGLNTSDEYEIKGFSNPSACGAKLSKMLTDPNDIENRNQHLILTKFTGSGGGLHYLPVGDVLEIGAAMKVDEKSIVTNETDGAFIYDFDTANDGEFPIKQDGVIKWIPTNEIHRVETMGNFAFNPETKQIAAGAVCIGRQYYHVAGMSAEGLSGNVRVEVNMETKQAVLASDDGFAKPTDTMSYIPIYEFSNGQIVSDYRGAPVVQCYEDDTEGTSE